MGDWDQFELGKWKCFVVFFWDGGFPIGFQNRTIDDQIMCMVLLLEATINVD